MELNYMDFQIRRIGRSRRATVYQNGKKIVSLRVKGRFSAEKLVKSAAKAMRKAGVIGAAA